MIMKQIIEIRKKDVVEFITYYKNGHIAQVEIAIPFFEEKKQTGVKIKYVCVYDKDGFFIREFNYRTNFYREVAEIFHTPFTEYQEIIKDLDDLRLEQMLVDILVPEEYLVFYKEIFNTRNADQEKLESAYFENKLPMPGFK